MMFLMFDQNRMKLSMFDQNKIHTNFLPNKNNILHIPFFLQEIQYLLIYAEWGL